MIAIKGWEPPYPLSVLQKVTSFPKACFENASLKVKLCAANGIPMRPKVPSFFRCWNFLAQLFVKIHLQRNGTEQKRTASRASAFPTELGFVMIPTAHGFFSILVPDIGDFLIKMVTNRAQACTRKLEPLYWTKQILNFHRGPSVSWQNQVQSEKRLL